MDAADSTLSRKAALGALVWALYAIVHVALNPVVVDETLLSAQILCETVHYPAGHPHEVFHRQAFSLPNHLSALLLTASDDPVLVSRVRNFLVVFLSGFGPFLVALLLTGRSLVGFAAAALVLTDCVYRFQGVYPTFLFPTFYSHGHVGAYGAIVTVALVSGGFRRSGAFLVGLFPSIHPLLGALVWMWCVPFVLRSERAGLRRLAVPALLGLGVSAASFAVSRAMVPDVAPEALYLPGAEDVGELVRRQFIEFTDPHRRMPPSDSGVFLFGYVGNCAVFLAFASVLLVALRSASGPLRRATLGVVGFGLLAWAAVWGARVLELVLGSMPAVLETAMPYRLSNLSAILLVPLGVAALVRATTGAGRGALRAASVVLALLALAAAAASADEVLRPEAYRRALRLVGGIGLFGAVLGTGLVLPGSAIRRAASALGLGVLGWAFLVQREKSGFQGAELLAAAAIGSAGLLAFVRRGDGARDAESGAPGELPFQRVLAVAVLVCTAATLRSGNAEPSSLITEFDDAVAEWLDEHADPDELLLAPLIPRTQLQSKTGHPVLLELGTLWLMPYLPGVSSVIGRMTADLYGVDYADRDRLLALAGEDGYLGQHDDVWKDVFQGRTRAEWQRLAALWNFRLVVAPTEWELPLDAKCVGAEWVLYEVPGR